MDGPNTFIEYGRVYVLPYTPSDIHALVGVYASHAFVVFEVENELYNPYHEENPYVFIDEFDIQVDRGGLKIFNTSSELELTVITNDGSKYPKFLSDIQDPVFANGRHEFSTFEDEKVVYVPVLIKYP
jgi:hypothetical protein